MPSGSLRGLVLMGLATVVAGCTRTPAAPEPAPAAATADGAPERVVAEYIAAYNRHDIPGMLRLADSAITWLSIAADSVHVETRGAAALQRALDQYFRAVPSARSTTEAMVSLGPWVTVHERAHWQSAGGARSQASVAVYEVQAGRIRRVWYFPVVR